MNNVTNKSNLATADVSNPFFSDDQRRAYSEDGYVVVPSLFDTQEAEKFAQWAQDIHEWPDVAGKYMKYYEKNATKEDQPLTRRAENFFPYQPEIAEIALSRRIGGAVAELLEESVYLFKDMLIYKYPGGDGYRYHQDHRAGWSQYADEMIRVGIAIDAADEENGCLQVTPGRHREGLFGEEWAMIPDKIAEEMDIHYCPMKPGDVVFFNSFTPHGSGPNRSNRTRRVMHLAFNRESDGDNREQHFRQKRAEFPPDFEREPGKVYLSGSERRGLIGMGGEDLDSSDNSVLRA